MRLSSSVAGDVEFVDLGAKASMTLVRGEAGRGFHRRRSCAS